MAGFNGHKKVYYGPVHQIQKIPIPLLGFTWRLSLVIHTVEGL